MSLMMKALLAKDAVKYGSYVAIGFLLIIFVAFMGGPEKNQQMGPLSCRPTGQVITVQELDQKLKGKGVFDGKAAAFIESGTKYKVDPVLVTAIALHETGQGTSNALRTKNNPGGLMGSNGLMVFPTLAAGIDKMTSNLYENYISQGLTTPELIGPKYAPIGASNDPTGLNRYWIPTVTKYVNDLGGLSYDCSVEDIGDLGPISSSGFLRPVDKKFPITSYFGPRWGRMHEGLDFGCTNKKTPIVAAKSGKVVASLFGDPGSGFGGYGNAVLIDHGGVKTLYAHLSSRSVQAGQHISQGQQIGVCGSTGHSTGPHLHFEVRIGDRAVDPLKYLGK